MAPFQALLAREQGDDRGTNGTVCLFQHQHFPGSRGRRDSRALIGNLMVVSARDAAPAFRDASRSVSHGDGSLMEAFIKSLARSVRPSRISRQPTHRKSPSLSLCPLTVGRWHPRRRPNLRRDHVVLPSAGVSTTPRARAWRGVRFAVPAQAGVDSIFHN
jgi:hypothetical protein